MAVVKSRTGKRSSSSGYSSTLTTIIFVSLCVLGVWMLSSDKVAPPKSTNRSAAATASIHSSSSVPDEERESPDPEPCLDNEKAIAKLRSRKHYEHRERHCPEEAPSCLVQLPLQPCMHRAPTEENVRGSEWPEKWPRRLQTPPYWLNRSQMGIYGKPAPEDFAADYEHWKHVVSKMYLSGLGISWSDVRNIMDMRAVYGGFAAALKDLKVWVMNVVNVDSPDTLPIIYERGLIGIYHDWCESFSTYPRTYDLLHADHLFSRLKKRCKLVPVLAEVDRVTRPGGKLIVRDDSTTMDEVENLLKSLHWEVHLTFSKNQEGILSAQKTNWRPDTHVAYS